MSQKQSKTRSETAAGPGHRVDEGAAQMAGLQHPTEVAASPGDSTGRRVHPKGDISLYNRRANVQVTERGKRKKTPKAPVQEDEDHPKGDSSLYNRRANGQITERGKRNKKKTPKAPVQVDEDHPKGDISLYNRRANGQITERGKRNKKKTTKAPVEEDKDAEDPKERKRTQRPTARQRRLNNELHNDDGVEASSSSFSDDADYQTCPGAVAVPAPGRPSAPAIRGFGDQAGTNYLYSSNPSVTNQEETSLSPVAVPVQATLATEDDSEFQLLKAEKEALQRQLEKQRDLQDGITSAEVVADVADVSSRTKWCLGFVVVAAIIVVVILLVKFLPPKETEDAVVGSGGELETKYPDLYRKFSNISGDALTDDSSPQFKAIEWLAQDYYLNPATDPEKELEQRYALAVLFFSTGNESPDNVSWTSSYDFLQSISFCNWNIINATSSLGVLCGKSTYVTSVRLPSNRLRGTLPSEISLLSDIQQLDLARNDLSETIPTEIGDLTNLLELKLNNNSFTGTFPTDLSRLSSLQDARFEFNKLSGSLDLCGLGGSLVADCSDENAVCVCCTSCCSSQKGECQLPRAFDLLTFLEERIGDTIYEDGTPEQLAAQWALRDDYVAVDAANLFQRFVLAAFYYATSDNGQQPWRSCNPPQEGEDDTCTLLEFTPLANGTFGYNPKPGKIRWLSGQDVCKWEGVICAGSSEVQGVTLLGQELSGTIPTILGRLAFLQLIALAYNELTGEIPDLYAGLHYLRDIELHGNMLSGTIPEAFYGQGPSATLRLFNVGDNLLSGALDTRLGLMTELRGLYLFENNFEGTFPTELENLNYLSFLRFNGNEFEGTLPTVLGFLGELSEFWAHENNFESTIPDQLVNLRRLEDLRLWGNDMTGTIPEGLYTLSNLLYFSVRDMSLTGTLSTRVGLLTDLEFLQVSTNYLTGQIPSEIGNLWGLRLLWFHLNQFSGSVPLNICDIVGPLFIGILQGDCLPFENPRNACPCCSACCDSLTEICLLREDG